MLHGDKNPRGPDDRLLWRCFGNPLRENTMQHVILVILLALCPAGGRAAVQAPAADSTWAGGIDLAGDWYSIQLTVRSEGGGKSATLDFPTVRDSTYHGIKVEKFVWTETSIHFEWSDADGRAVVDGVRARQRITGSFRQGTTSGKVVLTRGSFPDSATLLDLAGLYELGPGHEIWLGPISELSRQFGFVDTRTGRAGILYASSPTRLFSGTSSHYPFPVGIRLSWDRSDSEATRIMWTDKSGRPRLARRLRTYRSEDVSFSNGDVKLSGTLVVPVASGKHPAVVLMHGAGGQARTYFSSLPYQLANAGIAALIYDKRGVGRSTGNRRAATMADFADDAVAGVKFLQARSDIDARKIGVYGHSQGGWQAPLAAVRSGGAVGFVITAAGPAKEYHAQTNDEVANNLRFAGFTPRDVKEALAHQDLYFAVMRHQAPWAELEASTARVSTKPWARFVWKPRTETEVLSDTLEYIDPAPVLSNLRVPILAMYGGHDIRVDGRANAQVMRNLLQRAGNHNATVRFFPDADHDFWFARRLTTRDVSGTTGYVGGFFKTLLTWTNSQVANQR